MRALFRSTAAALAAMLLASACVPVTLVSMVIATAYIALRYL